MLLGDIVVRDVEAEVAGADIVHVSGIISEV